MVRFRAMIWGGGSLTQQEEQKPSLGFFSVPPEDSERMSRRLLLSEPMLTRGRGGGVEAVRSSWEEGERGEMDVDYAVRVVA